MSDGGDGGKRFRDFIYDVRYRIARFLYRTFGYRSSYFLFLDHDEDFWGNSSDDYFEFRLFKGLDRTSVRRRPMQAYRTLTKFRAYAYSKLSFKEALSVAPKLPTILLALALGARFDVLYTLIGRAFAAEPTPFVPPLGLTQTIYSIIVLMFAFLLFGIVCVMAWAGFLGRPKNQAAATAVTHLVTFVAGVLLGGKV